MKAGIYINKKHPQDKYLFIGLARQHYTNEEVIVYIPLRIEPEWVGTARMVYRTGKMSPGMVTGLLSATLEPHSSIVSSHFSFY